MSCDRLLIKKFIFKTIKKVIPFGVLCFFPSYTTLKKLMARWKETKLVDQICLHKKIFNEADPVKDFDNMLKDYYECIKECESGRSSRGALLFGVYRGRASEGLDFSDNYARAVIAIGIPYPNVKDIQVDLKRKYNNLLTGKKNLLNGDEWYEIQAYRAVNQALGRCIRHK
jgi:Fanconi anemia group J protein